MSLPSSSTVTLFAVALVAIVGLALVGLFTYIRLAPEDPERWHVAVPPIEGEAGSVAAFVSVIPLGAVAFVPAANPVEALAHFFDVAATTPRVSFLKGSVAEGRITFVARSSLFGFPYYITAETTNAGLRIFSRQRFGSNDFGVNAARLTGWLTQLEAR